ncbi:MAG TPA: beta-phosphoglucomutase [Clostridia bacterium]
MLKGVIFDLDGVIVSTDNYHYLAWKRMADEENIYFDRKINDRLRGVSRMQSLEILLERSKKNYTQAQKEDMAQRKNTYYQELIKNLTPKDILKGAKEFAQELKDFNIKIAVGSSSKNCKDIINYIGLNGFFDAVADGTMINNSKPDPEVFLLAAKLINIEPENCLVVEDAHSGIIAAKNAGMYALAIGAAQTCGIADMKSKDLGSLDASMVISKF